MHPHRPAITPRNMSDEASSSTAAPLNADQANGDEVGHGVPEVDDGDDLKKLRKETLRRLDDLQRAFDMVIYAELATLYYMEYDEQPIQS